MDQPSPTIKVPRRAVALESILAALESLLDNALPSEQDKLRGIITTLGGLADSEPPAAEVAPPASEPSEEEQQRLLSSLREHLREQREAAGLTRAQLADRIGVSESTIKLAETPNKQSNLSPRTLRQLLALPELRLNPHHPCIAVLLGARRPRLQTHSFSGWADRDLDPLRCAAELRALLASEGGAIPAHLLAIDPLSARDLMLAQPPAPLPPWSDLVSQLRGVVLDLIMLGCSDGSIEDALVQHLGEVGLRDVRLYLIEASQPLLSQTFHQAAALLGATFWIHGDLLRLPLYTHSLFLSEAPRRRQLVCLLGGALGLLPDDQRYLQELQAGLLPGDLLLLQVELSTPQQDPWLRQLPAEVVGWLDGVVRRYGDQNIDITLRAGLAPLDRVCPIPGSYLLKVQAQVQAAGRPERTFSMLRTRRYDRARLLDHLRQEGWTLLNGWHSPGGRRFTVLLRR